MSGVRLRITQGLIEEVFRLGTMRVTGAWFEQYAGGNGALVLYVDAPDAPEGMHQMSPVYRREPDGTVTMVDPGWAP